MWHTDLERATRTNRDWRRVLFTGDYLQVVLMSVPPGEELGWEMHDDTDQFFRVDAADTKGTAGTSGEVRTVQHHARGRQDSVRVNVVDLVDGSATVVLAGTWHNVVNTSKTTPLNFYTIYAPPHHHPRGTRQKNTSRETCQGDREVTEKVQVTREKKILPQK